VNILIPALFLAWWAFIFGFILGRAVGLTERDQDDRFREASCLVREGNRQKESIMLGFIKKIVNAVIGVFGWKWNGDKRAT
jgi:hypothetical protein